MTETLVEVIDCNVKYMLSWRYLPMNFPMKN